MSMTQNQPTSGNFDELGIAPTILAILTQHKFLAPTPIQRQAIPPAIEGKDVIGIAQTGTGKTLAFGVPMLQRLGINGGQGLVLAPTRELALQIHETLQKIGGSLGLKMAVLIGGVPPDRQIRALRQGVHVIIATPGRLVDHLQQKIFNLNNVKVVVLDEADRMFDIGFAPQIERILKMVPRVRQTMLFSATMPGPIAHLAAQYMQLPLRIEVAPAGTAAAQVEQEVFIVSKEMKLSLLHKILTETHGATLVFTRTKFAAKRVAATIRRMNQSAVEMHSNRSLAQRREALDGFKNGKYRILVATDIAARGIDVTGIALVLNFDLPDDSGDYVHRIGRTGRAGRSGKAISFATPDQRNDIRSIEKLLRKTLPIVALPVLPAAPPLAPAPPTNSFGPATQMGVSRPFRGPPRSGHSGQGGRRFHR